MLVVYHGARPWNIPTTFAGLYEDYDESDKLSLNFGYILVDVARIAPEAMPEHAALRAGLLAMKHAQLTVFRQEDAALLAEAIQPTDEEFRKVTMAYVVRAFRGRHLGTALEKAFDKFSENRKMYQTIADKLIGQGERKGNRAGILKGRREGILEGQAQGREIGAWEAKAQTLTLQLSQRFGTVQDAVRQRLSEAKEAELDAWLGRVIVAASIEDVMVDS